MPDVFLDAAARYEAAVARCEGIRAEWERQGMPLLGEGSTGQSVKHPLLKVLEEAERHADVLGRALQKQHRGPQPSAVLKPSIGKSPATKLRAVR